MTTGPSSQWTERRLQQYIEDEVEESLTLECKAAEALQSKDRYRREITKDVSAMANSAGGLIIYGIREHRDAPKKHLPERLDPVNRSTFSRETLERIIGNIRPRIDGIIIHVVSFARGDDACAYIVEIPQGTTAHQAADNKYYRRHNFECSPMHDHEIRDVMSRSSHPKIEIEFSILRTEEVEYERSALSMLQPREVTRRAAYRLEVRARNNGRVYAQYVNACVSIPRELLEDPHLGVDHEDGSHRKIWAMNTTRDIMEMKGTPPSMYPVRGPARYEPILPSLSFYLRSIRLSSEFSDLVTPSTLIGWDAYADNAGQRSGQIHVSQIEVCDEDEY